MLIDTDTVMRSGIYYIKSIISFRRHNYLSYKCDKENGSQIRSTIDSKGILRYPGNHLVKTYRCPKLEQQVLAEGALQSHPNSKSAPKISGIQNWH